MLHRYKLVMDPHCTNIVSITERTTKVTKTYSHNKVLLPRGLFKLDASREHQRLGVFNSTVFGSVRVNSGVLAPPTCAGACRHPCPSLGSLASRSLSVATNARHSHRALGYFPIIERAFCPDADARR